MMASAPHLNPDAGIQGVDLDHPVPPVTSVRQWLPKRVLITRAARDWPHARTMAERCVERGIDVVELRSDRTGIPVDAPYAYAKSTLAVVVAPASKLRLTIVKAGK